MKRIAIVMAATIAAVAPTFALSAFLSRDHGVSGFMRYCEYSNGETYTVNSTSLCPMSVETGFSYSNPVTGFLAGEYQDGMTKVCVYDVLGEQKAIRLSSVALCPLSQKF